MNRRTDAETDRLVVSLPSISSYKRDELRNTYVCILFVCIQNDPFYRTCTMDSSTLRFIKYERPKVMRHDRGFREFHLHLTGRP